MTGLEGSSAAARHDYRFVRVQGGLNMRDMGGVPLADGKVTRRGLVYRADALSWLTDAGRAAFDELGLKTVIDVREEHEFAIKPTGWMREAGPKVFHEPSAIPRRSGLGGKVKFDPATLDAETLRASRNEGYARKPLELSVATNRLFACIADPSLTPVMFHCAGGADRTGVMAAVLLLFLGASREQVMEDYLLTNLRWGAGDLDDYELKERDVLSAYGLQDLNPEALAALSELMPEYLTTALGVIDSEYGGVPAYLAATCGIGQDIRHQVRERLTAAEPA